MFGHITKLITAYHHNELSPKNRQHVEVHVMRCARCRQDLEAIKQVVGLVALGLRNPLPADVYEPRSRKLRWVLVAATALMALILTVGIYSWRETQLPAWDVASASGVVTKLRLGHWLNTGSSESTVRIENVGEVRVEPNSRLRLLESKPDEYRMELQQGTMHAQVWAPPRLFFVETPSATAIDLGCRYDLTVDKSGNGVLTVTLGLVELESKGRSSTVLAGWTAKTRRHEGPGTPYSAEASEDMQQALDILDFGSDAGKKADALNLVLNTAKDRDVVTLWHLLPRVDGESRKRVYEKMLILADAPKDVTMNGILDLDPDMMSRWKSHIGLTW